VLREHFVCFVVLGYDVDVAAADVFCGYLIGMELQCSPNLTVV
jgi:hypothetical protein